MISAPTLTTSGSVQLPRTYYENMKDETLSPLEFIEILIIDFSKILIAPIYFGHDHDKYDFQKPSH